MIFKKKFTFYFLIGMCTLTLIGGCGKKSTFISKSKLQKKVEGTWHLVPLLMNDVDEDWAFNPDKTITITVVGSGVISNSGKYSVSAKLMNSQIKMSGMNQEIYNGTWYIIDVTKDRMQINIAYKDCGGADHCGTYQREFIR